LLIVYFAVLLLSMDCQQNIVRLTYKQLKEMAEGSKSEEVAGSIH